MATVGVKGLTERFIETRLQLGTLSTKSHYLSEDGEWRAEIVS